MSTRTLTTESIARPRMLAASIGALVALAVLGAVLGAVLVGQPTTPTATFTDRYANLAGMGGLTNPFPRTESASGSRPSTIPLTYGNLAGMGGLPNPAPRPAVHPVAGFMDRYGNLAGMGGLPNPAPRD